MTSPPASPASPEGPGAPGDPAVLASGLRLAVSRITRRLRQNHAVGDVSLSGVSVLARLASEGPDSPGALADLEHVRPQAMAATLAALEERGLVARTPHAADGRRSVITVTDEGRAVVRERRSESVQRLTEVLGGAFTPADRDALAAVMPLLDRLAERL